MSRHKVTFLNMKRIGDSRRRQLCSYTKRCTAVFLIIAATVCVFFPSLCISKGGRFLSLEDTKNKIGTVHLGKCGGITLEHTFRRHRQKRKHRAMDSIILQRRGKRYHIYKPDVDLYVNWLVLIRDPIDRILSSWIFEQVDNYPFKKNPRPHAFKYELFECYNHLDVLLTNGVFVNNDGDDLCPLLARQLFQSPLCGEGYGIYHFQFNYSHYYTKLLQEAHNKRIFALRSEHMLEDLNAVEVLLGAASNETFEELAPWNHYKVPSRQNLPYHNTTLSARGLAILCNVLCDEIQIYKQLYRAARNLGQVEWREMMTRLGSRCPSEAASNTCPNREVRLTQPEKTRIKDAYCGAWGYPPNFNGLDGQNEQQHQALTTG